MATTTNYGWTTPDNTALVKDGASAIRTLGSSIDTTTKNLNPSTTLGDIEYRSATANTNTRLALGTAGQILTVNSSATAPEWKDASGSGYSNYQVFTSSTTWTVPAGITKCAVYVVGGGGGGGGGAARVAAANVIGGDGGNGGSYGFDPFFLVTPASSVTITVGAGGAGGAANVVTNTNVSGNPGSVGSSSSFGSLLAQNGLGGNGYSTTYSSGYNTDTLAVLNSTVTSVKAGGTGGYSQGFSSAVAGRVGTVSILNTAGSLGNNGSNPTAGTFTTNGATATNAGFGGGGGCGGGHENGVGSANSSAGVYAGGGGGGGSKSTTDITTTAGAGGAGATNRGGGGGGGGAAGKVGTGGAVCTSGAGGNGGSGFVAVFY